MKDPLSAVGDPSESPHYLAMLLDASDSLLRLEENYTVHASALPV